MYERLLEQVGLTKSEIKVYLALLELGISTSGPIVHKSKTTSSKIYEILEKLGNKGLVSYHKRAGKKYFEAATPERILDYVEEKEKQILEQKQNIKKIIPELKLRKKFQGLTSEAHVFKGIKGAETVFNKVIAKKIPGEALSILGMTQVSDEFARFLKKMHAKREKKKILARVLRGDTNTLIDDTFTNNRYTKTKRLPQAQSFPTAFLTYHDKVLISYGGDAKRLRFFLIEDKEVAQNFKSHFNLLWNQETQTLRGKEGAKEVCRQSLEHKEMFIIAAQGGLYDTYPELFHWLMREKKKKGVIFNFIFDESQRKRKLVKFPDNVKFLSTLKSPNVTWIYGDTVVNAVWVKEPIFFLIHNKEIADQQKRYYRFLEKIAKK